MLVIFNHVQGYEIEWHFERQRIKVEMVLLKKTKQKE